MKRCRVKMKSLSWLYSAGVIHESPKKERLKPFPTAWKIYKFSLTILHKKSKIYKVKPKQNNHTVPIKICYGKIVLNYKNLLTLADLYGKLIIPLL